ncbi:MAG: oligosaccharide flippase family protein [Bacteroidetes bacterium]|nr:oligosaccharide flippase family protein [Bacteroidota bacterium]
MTKEEYGLYGYLVSIISSFALFLGFGLYVPQIKMYHDLKGEKEKGSFLFTLNISLVAILLVVFSVLYFFNLDILVISFLFKQDINYLAYRVYILGAIIVAIIALMLYSYFLTTENLRNVKLYNILKLVFVNSTVLLILYFFKTDAVLTRLKYALYIEAILFFAFGYFFVRKMVPKFRIDLLRRAFKIGIPIMLGSFVGMLYSLSDRFFLEKYDSFQVIGVYNLGLALSSIIPLSMTSFQSIYAPIFFKEKDHKLNLKRVNKIALLLMGIYTLISVGIVILTYFLISFGIINKSYTTVTFLLPIILLGSIFYALSQLYQNFMAHFEVTHISLIFHIISSFIAVILCFLLVPTLSLYGAAFALCIAAASSAIMHFAYVSKKIK